MGGGHRSKDLRQIVVAINGKTLKTNQSQELTRTRKARKHTPAVLCFAARAALKRVGMKTSSRTSSDQTAKSSLPLFPSWLQGVVDQLLSCMKDSKILQERLANTRKLTIFGSS